MKAYNKLILFYFTGTGNALKAGRWICKEAEKKNIKAFMYAIDDKYKPNSKDLDSNTLIGFLTPTHGFNIAPAMLRFIMKFPAKIKADVFILNTRAGLKFLKYKYFGNLFKYTSFSAYWRRYRAPGIDLKDYKKK